MSHCYAWKDRLLPLVERLARRRRTGCCPWQRDILDRACRSATRRRTGCCPWRGDVLDDACRAATRRRTGCCPWRGDILDDACRAATRTKTGCCPWRGDIPDDACRTATRRKTGCYPWRGDISDDASRIAAGRGSVGISVQLASRRRTGQPALLCNEGCPAARFDLARLTPLTDRSETFSRKKNDLSYGPEPRGPTVASCTASTPSTTCGRAGNAPRWSPRHRSCIVDREGLGRRLARLGASDYDALERVALDAASVEDHKPRIGHGCGSEHPAGTMGSPTWATSRHLPCVTKLKGTLMVDPFEPGASNFARRATRAMQLAT